MVERLPYKQDVGGSTPSSPTSFKDAVVAQLVRVSACHAEGRGFESRPPRQNIKKTSIEVSFLLSAEFTGRIDGNTSCKILSKFKPS